MVKNIPIVISCDLNKDDKILIVFDTSILDTPGHQMTVQVLTSSNCCRSMASCLENIHTINY